MNANRIIVTTGGDHTSVEVIVGLIFTYQRDIQYSNNSIMDTIIVCPEAVNVNHGRDLKFEWRLMYYIYVEKPS